MFVMRGGGGCVCVCVCLKTYAKDFVCVIYNPNVEGARCVCGFGRGTEYFFGDGDCDGLTEPYIFVNDAYC